MVVSLRTAQELEEILGVKYFYRQAIYRLAQDGVISSFEVNGVFYFSTQDVTTQALKRLAKRIRNRFPWLPIRNLRVKFDETTSKKIIIYGFSDRSVIRANTQNETEEDLLRKIENLRKEVKNMPDLPIDQADDRPHMPPPGHHPHPGPKPGPEEHHHEIIEMLRRLDERLRKLEERLG